MKSQRSADSGIDLTRHYSLDFPPFNYFNLHGLQDLDGSIL